MGKRSELNKKSPKEELDNQDKFSVTLERLGPLLGEKWFNKVAEDAGITTQYLWTVRKGKRKGSESLRRKIASCFNMTLDEFLNLGNEYDVSPILEGIKSSARRENAAPWDNFAQVPLVSAHLSAGNGTFIEAENIESFIIFRKDWLNSKGGKNGKYALLVDGDSMEPEIRDGDLVLIDTSEDGRRPRPGKIFAARQLNTIVIKRLMPDETKENIVRLISENPAYPPITIDLADSSNKILGRVIWVAREL